MNKHTTEALEALEALEAVLFCRILLCRMWSKKEEKLVDAIIVEDAEERNE